MSKSLRAVFANSLCLEDGGETLVIAPRGDLPALSPAQTRDLSSTVRSRLSRLVRTGDVDVLRRKLIAWDIPLRGGTSSEAVFDAAADAVSTGRLTARILPTGVSEFEMSSKAPAPVSQPGAPGKPVSQMSAVEKLGTMLWKTAHKEELPGEIRAQLLSLLETFGIIRIGMILFAWLSAQLAGPYAWIADILLAAALIALADMTATMIEETAKNLYEAFKIAINAHEEADVDRAATLMVPVITTIGLALFTIALGRGTNKQESGAKKSPGGKSSTDLLKEEEQRRDDRRQRLDARMKAWQDNNKAKLEDEARQKQLAAAAPRTAPELTKADLDAYRNRLGVPDDLNTIAVGRTNVPGLEGETFEGASPKVRKAAGLQDLDDVAPNRPIKSPNSAAIASRHAEEDLANNFVSKVEGAGLKPADLDGKTLNIRISNDTGVCRTCMQGLSEGSNAPAGVIKQLSERYPGLTIRIAAEGGNAYPERPIVEIRDGRIIN